MTGQENDQMLEDILYLMGCAVHDVRPDRDRVERMDLTQLYRVSRFHALTNLVYEAVLSAYGGTLPDTPVLKKWREERDKAVTKNLLLDAERAALFAWMEQAGIWYMPLKGCILKDLYPKSGMRQMSDNDILFDPAGRKQVRDWFAARGYKIKAYKTDVVDCYLKEPIYNFEMHTELISVAYSPERQAWADYYRDVKRRLLPEPGTRCGYRFSDEDFYIFNAVHSCKHYRGGGTGLRTLLDFHVFLAAKGGSLDWDYIRAELRKLKVEEFESRTRELAEKAFTDPERLIAEDFPEEDRRFLEEYLSAGVYGTLEKRMQGKLAKLGGEEGGVTRRVKLKYLRSRLLPEREFIISWCGESAPFFLRHQRLLPLAYVWRLWVKGVYGLPRAMRELRILRRMK